jgi:hypothetical protein
MSNSTPPPLPLLNALHLLSKMPTWSIDQGGKWTLDAIAEYINIIPHHMNDHQDKLLAKGEHVSTDSKIIALVLMYSFIITKINLAEAICQSQNKATAMNLQQQQQKQKSTKPLPPNFQNNASNVCILWLC